MDIIAQTGTAAVPNKQMILFSYKVLRDLRDCRGNKDLRERADLRDRQALREHAEIPDAVAPSAPAVWPDLPGRADLRACVETQGRKAIREFRGHRAHADLSVILDLPETGGLPGRREILESWDPPDHRENQEMLA